MIVVSPAFKQYLIMYDVAYYARQDISKYLYEEIGWERRGSGGLYNKSEIWVACPSYVFTKESRKLNRELKLNGINRLNNKNGYIPII